MSVNVDFQVNQIHDFLSQVINFKEHATRPSYTAIGNRLLVCPRVVSQFLKKPYAGKLSKNFVMLNPKEVATWPKNCQSIGKKLQPEDIISFLPDLKKGTRSVLLNPKQNLPHLPIGVYRSVFLNLDYQSLAKARKICIIWNSIIEEFNNKDWKQIYRNSLPMFRERSKSKYMFEGIHNQLNHLSPDHFFSIVLFNSLVMKKEAKINFNSIKKNASVRLEELEMYVPPSVERRVTGYSDYEFGSDEEDLGYAEKTLAILSQDGEKIGEFFQEIDDDSVTGNETSIRNFLWANKHLIILDWKNNIFYHEVKKSNGIQESKLLERVTGDQRGNEYQFYTEFREAYLINHLILFSFVVKGSFTKKWCWRLFNTKEKSFNKIKLAAVQMLQISQIKNKKRN